MDDKNPLIVTLNGKFFDVSEFASKHPGGQKILQKVAGEEISKYMAGQEKVLSVGHEHSSSAYDILSRYSLEGEFMVFDFDSLF
jgi:4-hydroxysphinganine ceramide fatty acyl 2-hydroxylase